MSLLSTKIPIKGGSRSTKLLFLLAFLLLGISNSKAADVELVIGQSVAVPYSSQSDTYYFTPKEGGKFTLTIKDTHDPVAGFDMGAYNAFSSLLHKDSDSSSVTPTEYDGDANSAMGATWNVEAGVKYYLQFSYYGCTFTTSLEGGIEENDGITWTKIVMDTPYTVAPYYLTYTPSENGTLTAKQYGTITSCLYNDDKGLDQINAFGGLESPVELEYTLVKGKQYYYIAASEVTSVTFSWKGENDDDGDDDPTGVIKLDTKYSVKDGSDLIGIFTPKQSGTVTVKFSMNGQPYTTGYFGDFVYTDDTYSNNVQLVYESPASEVKFNVTQGTKYYINMNIWSISFTNITVDVVFTMGSDPGTTDPDPDDPDEPNPEYKGATRMPIGEGLKQVTGIGSNFYYYVPDANGTLTVTQYVSNDSHLFKSDFDPENAEYNTPIPTGYSGESPYPLKYSLIAGETYYFYSKLNSNDNLSQVSFEFEKAPDVVPMEEIELDKPFTVNSNKTLKFNCNFTGTLLVKWDNKYYPQENFFLFLDQNLGNYVQLDIWERVEGKGGYFYFTVTAGQTYYFCPIDYTGTFTFTESEPLIPMLKNVYPQAGSGLDASAYDTSVNVQFAPMNVTYGDIILTYYDESNTKKDVTVENVDFVNGELHFGLPQYALIDPSTNQPMSVGRIYSDSDIVYTIKNVKYNGVPVTEVDINLPGSSYVKVDNEGNFTITYRTGSPAKLTSSSFPSTFLGFWTIGDEKGKAVLTFDQDLDPSSVLEISVIEGAQSLDSPPGENDKVFPVSKYSISGNTLTIDFTGQKFQATKSTITVKVSGLWGANGILVSYGDANTLMQQIPFDTSSVIPDEVLVIMGEIGTLTWNPKGTDFNKGTITWTDDVAVNFDIKVEPVGDFASNTEPSAWSEETGMPEWMWNQMQSIAGSNNEVDGYYKAPVVKGEIADYTDYKYYDFNLLFGCSGTYKITVTPSVSDPTLKVLINGGTSYEETFKVLPSLKNAFDYTHDDDTFERDGLSINGYHMRDMGGELTINYPKDDLGPNAPRAILYIPGLYGADIYYQYDGMPAAASEARAAKRGAAPSGYAKVENGVIDLSGASQNVNTTINLHVEKNGVSSTDGEKPDYQIILAPTTNFTTGVDEVEVADDNAEVEYYDLNGNRVNSDNLVKGIYIVKQGNKAYKIVK